MAEPMPGLKGRRELSSSVLSRLKGVRQSVLSTQAAVVAYPYTKRHENKVTGWHGTGKRLGALEGPDGTKALIAQTYSHADRDAEEIGGVPVGPKVTWTQNTEQTTREGWHAVPQHALERAKQNNAFSLFIIGLVGGVAGLYTKCSGFPGAQTHMNSVTIADAQGNVLIGNVVVLQVPLNPAYPPQEIMTVQESEGKLFRLHTERL